MIDFNLQNGLFMTFSPDSVKAGQKYIDTVKEDLNAGKTNLYYLGLHLIDIYQIRVYRSYADELYPDCRYHLSNCSSNVFFAFCLQEFGLDKSQVSRYMNIVSEFGDGGRGFAPYWKDFSYSALTELLPLSDEERKKVKPDWTIKEIREYKKGLVKDDVATSQQKDHTVASYALEYDEVRLNRRSSPLEEFDFGSVNDNNIGDKIIEFCKNFYVGFDYAGYGISAPERCKAVCATLALANDLSHKFKNEFFHKNISCLIPLLNKAGYNI